MRKTLFTSLIAGTLALFLMNACAEDDKDAKATAEPAVVTGDLNVSGDSAESIMDQPVDFSTPEDVEKSLQKVREQAGDQAYKNLQSAMKYILYYDLSLANNKEKMYQKLNGSTPNEILAKMKR